MEKPILIYAYDPLCGWCFGFHPVIDKLATRFKENLHIHVVPGGLAIDENAQAIGEGYSYIRGAIPQVEKTTGVEFGENFKLLAEEGSYLYDSEPSCIAQTTINELLPEKSLDFAGRLQHALFTDGENLNDIDTFTGLIEDYTITPDQFKKTYQDEKTAQKTHEHFDWCKKTGASAFPALMLQIGDETGLISRGYRPYDTIESHLHHIIRNIEKISS